MSEIERYLEEIDRLITQIPYRLSTRIERKCWGQIFIVEEQRPDLTAEYAKDAEERDWSQTMNIEYA